MDEQVEFCSQLDRVVLLLVFFLGGEMRHDWGPYSVFNKGFCTPVVKSSNAD